MELASSLAHDGPCLRTELAFVPEAVPHARSIVRAQAVGVPPHLVADAELLTSEVVSNAVLHGSPQLYLSVVAADEHLTVEVTDGSDVVPPMPSAHTDPDSVGGRGLRIVQLVASEWGIRVDALGKTVWFRVAGRGVRPAHSKNNHPEENHPWT